MPSPEVATKAGSRFDNVACLRRYPGSGRRCDSSAGGRLVELLRFRRGKRRGVLSVMPRVGMTEVTQNCRRFRRCRCLRQGFDWIGDSELEESAWK